jgi:hypothetical protein
MPPPSGRSRLEPGSTRRLFGVALALLLVAGACGSSAAPAHSSAAHPSGSGADSGATLSSGLASGLGKLTSYKFTESNAGAPGAMPSNGGSYSLSGTVINSPVVSIWIKEPAAQFMVIGSDGWTSVDGKNWSTADSGDLSLADLLPAGEYITWFDAKASYFMAVGEELKNNVPCIHYQGNSALTSIYVGLSGGAAPFRADVWIAKDGNYPVSGAYGFSAAATGSATATDSAASWGFSFDITDVNSDANTVVAPVNVVAFPT